MTAPGHTTGRHQLCRPLQRHAGQRHSNHSGVHQPGSQQQDSLYRRYADIPGRPASQWRIRGDTRRGLDTVPSRSGLYQPRLCEFRSRRHGEPIWPVHRNELHGARFNLFLCQPYADQSCYSARARLHLRRAARALECRLPYERTRNPPALHLHASARRRSTVAGAVHHAKHRRQYFQPKHLAVLCGGAGAVAIRRIQFQDQPQRHRHSLFTGEPGDQRSRG